MPGAGDRGNELSSARHGDLTVDENYDIFFEAFCLFITSERLDISATIATTEVSNTFVFTRAPLRDESHHECKRG